MHRVKESNSLNIPDLFRFLGTHWKWYLLSILVFVGYFVYDYSRTAYVYSRTVTIMIRSADNTPETVRMQRVRGYQTRTGGAEEILQLRTKELMRSAISRIQADVSYTVKTGLRRMELYKDAPVSVSFPDAAPRDAFGFELRAIDKQRVELSGFPGKEIFMANLNDTINTPVGRMVIEPTARYKPSPDVRLTVTKYNRESMVAYYLGNLTIRQPQASVPILEISIKDRSGSRASDMLYTLINTFNEKSIEDKNRIAVNMGKFIHDRLSIIEQDLDQVESNLEALKEKNAGLDVSTSAGFYITDSREYQTSNKELESRMQLVSYMKQYLENETNISDLIPNSAGFGNADIEKQISHYNNTVLKRNRLSEGNNRNNPIVQEVDMSLMIMRTNLLASVAGLQASLELIKEKNRKEELVAREKILEIPLKQREVLSVERQQKVKEDLYLFLLNKREENALNGAMTDSNARIIDSPSGSINPISPVRLKKIGLGLGCGLALPTFVLLLLFKFDTRIRSRKDIEGVVSVPFMGSIPLSKKSKTGEPVAVKADGRDGLSESFRILRANLGFIASEDPDKKVITCISFNPGAGKTFISLNLAVCLSLTGKKVIVLDLDLRKATLSNLTHTRKAAGISHYLSSKNITEEEIIQHDVFGAGIDMIPAGAIAPNPSELLMSERLDELMAKLKKMYDYIVIDNVPIGMVADSAIIDRVTDISLFIVRSGKLDRRQLFELEQLYQDKKLKNMAVLLNGVTKHSEYGYGYGYGYSN